LFDRASIAETEFAPFRAGKQAAMRIAFAAVHPAAALFASFARFLQPAGL
jgi:hypothetical protein